MKRGIKLEKNFDYDLINNQIHNLMDELLVMKSIKMIGKFQKKLMNKAFRVGEQESNYMVKLNNEEVEILIKNKIAKRNDRVFKKSNIKDGVRYYVNFISSSGALLESKQFGVVVIDIIKETDNLTNLNVTVFSRSSIGMHELPLEVVEEEYVLSIKNKLKKEEQKTSSKENFEYSPELSADEDVESMYHRDYISSQILYNKEYLSPYAEQTFRHEMDGDNKLKRKLKNTFVMMNNRNIFSSTLGQPTNAYQEKLFPPIDKKVDFQEFTADYAWDDEICYFYSMSKYLDYEIDGGDRIYMSTSFNLGYSNIGTYSEIDTGADDMIWREKACGELFITENGITIFDKGYQTKLEKLTGLTGYMRRVIQISFSDIDVVQGVIQDNIIKIILKDGRIIGLQKANSRRQGIGFTEDENIYIVNLIASIILNENSYDSNQ
ncbi:hypothetical protein NFW97_002220 [Enterococcus faecalis]|uniref:hypothetical protein n=1 Tax=Enterococcus faecalis TaxID=1351 RepID=UPI00066913BF|nr:hypothetical protein [Enterococcus faecalis]EGO8211855.1 hypothetical protein [Enterococcus faecalis]EHH1613358.1 hypothetical protein [Enterococcus faecalis]EJI7157077.1 hypothetical protein [Enterococcus faecalis]ELU9007882.1 hypothetical protein [Enterococcus faecalis]MCD5170922.1 hypothetical protein [Enterococcus faecalis]